MRRAIGTNRAQWQVLYGLTAVLGLIATPQLCRADAHELTTVLDARAVLIDSPLKSFTKGGLGSLRFDEADSTLQLGRLTFDATGPIGETLRYNVVASATGDDDQNPIDLTEAYINWRPYPRSAWKWRARAGAFYAPISLENRAIGWGSLYSLSPSAINTWLGEEFRTIGVEIETTSVGAFADRTFDLKFLGVVYAWNDPAGVLLFERGWAMHDRQSPLFGALPRSFILDPANRSMKFFKEIDDRIGYYAGAEIAWPDDSVVRVLHYDNRGDPDEASATEPAWRTRFDAVGIRGALPGEVTLIAQGMWGDTEVGPQGTGSGLFQAEYWSYFGLGSCKIGRNRFTVRYDRMRVDTVRGWALFDSAQDATGWTVAYMFDVDERWQLAIEGMRISGWLAQRALRGLDPQATEEQVNSPCDSRCELSIQGRRSVSLTS